MRVPEAIHSKLDQMRGDDRGYADNDIINGAFLAFGVLVGSVTIGSCGFTYANVDRGYDPHKITTCQEGDEENPLVTIDGLEIMLGFYDSSGSYIEDPAANTAFVHDPLNTDGPGESGCVAPDGSTPEGFVHLTGGNSQDPEGSIAILGLQGGPVVVKSQVHFGQEWGVKPAPGNNPGLPYAT